MLESTPSACPFKLLNTTAHKPSLSQTFTYSFSPVNLQASEQIDKLAIGITINTYIGNTVCKSGKPDTTLNYRTK